MDDTQILYQLEFHTVRHGVGFRRHVYFSVKVHNGSCGVGGLMIQTFSTSQSSTLVLMWFELEDTSTYKTRSTMVHVGWVAG